MPLINAADYWGDDSEFIGSMPIRQDIEVLPADEPRVPIDNQVTIDSKNSGPKTNTGILKLGWIINETIGIGVINKNFSKLMVNGEK